jgi:hypothetical protein
MGLMRLVLHIDRLMLSGCDESQRLALAEGLRAELARQLRPAATARLLQGGADTARINAGAVHVAAGAAPASIGVGAAKGIARGLIR